MTINFQKIQIFSEEGDNCFPNSLTIELDGSQINCPVTFWSGKTPVFSMGAEEISAFCKALGQIDSPYRDE
jgi:hypothetical protein